MKEELITLETAKLAKEKGFNIPVYFHYSENTVNDLIFLCEPDDPQLGNGWNLENYNSDNWLSKKYSAPSQSILQKWLREVHNIHAEILLSDNNPYNEFYYRIMKIGQYFTLSHLGIYKSTYEDALEESLIQSLKLIK